MPPFIIMFLIYPQYWDLYPKDIHLGSLGISKYKFNSDLPLEWYNEEDEYLAADLRYYLDNYSSLREDLGLTRDASLEKRLEAIEKYSFVLYNNGIVLVENEHLVKSTEELKRFFPSLITNETYRDRAHLLIDRFIRTERECFAKQKNKYKETLNKKRVSKIISPVLNDFYGEENVEVKIEDNSVITTIKYGDTYISNLSKSHKILDLYVRITFGLSRLRSDTHHKGFGVNKIEGMRGTFTNSERRVAYIHSHLPRNYDNFSKFCLGDSGAANFMVQKLSLKDIEKAKEDLEEFLILVDHLIQFEDVDNPYIKISQIGVRSTAPRSRHQISYTVSRHKNTLLMNSEIKIINTSSDNEDISIKVKPTGEYLDEVHPNLLVVKESDNKYYDYRQYMELIQRMKKVTDKGQIILETIQTDETFKGEKIDIKVIEDDIESINSDPVRVIHPEVENILTKKHKSKLLKLANEYVQNKKERNKEVEVSSSN